MGRIATTLFFFSLSPLLWRCETSCVVRKGLQLSARLLTSLLSPWPCLSFVAVLLFLVHVWSRMNMKEPALQIIHWPKMCACVCVCVRAHARAMSFTLHCYFSCFVHIPVTEVTSYHMGISLKQSCCCCWFSSFLLSFLRLPPFSKFRIFLFGVCLLLCFLFLCCCF